MSFQHHGADAMGYAPCYYKDIQIPFRGPKRDLDGPYIACLGGAGMFGKFLPRALPDLVEEAFGIPAVNLGQVSGGVDVMGSDPLLEITRGAVATVVDLVGAHNQSNRFYRVHPRRNDRVVGPTPLMREVFPELELTDVHFTRHLLTMMQAVAPARTETVIEDLRVSWLEKMHWLLSETPGPVILLWLGGGPIPLRSDDVAARVPFVDEHMVSHLAAGADGLVVIDGRDLRHDVSGMTIPEGAERQGALLPTAAEVTFAGERVVHALHRCLSRPVGKVRQAGP